MTRFVLGFALALAAMMAPAQPLELISLKFRTAEQVLDTLRPLLEPGGTLTGQGNQLILRASAANAAEIRRALEAIDRPSRRLQISVRFDDALESSRREIGASGSIGDRGARIEVRGAESQRQALERVDQRVQVMDGGRAMIQAGQSRPVRQRQYIQTPAGVVSQEITVLQEATSGFDVSPWMAGDTVTVDIYAARSARIESTASGRLGEWFELGSVATGNGTRRVFVKVEALGD